MPRQSIFRAALALIGVAIPLAAVAGCSAHDTLHAQARAEASPAAVLDVDDPSGASVSASKATFESSQLVFVATAERAPDLVDDAITAGAPLLVDGPELASELQRLGVQVVVTANGDSPELPDGGLETLSIDASADPTSTDVPSLARTDPAAPAVLFAPGDVPEALAAAAATVSAVAGQVEQLAPGDPRGSQAAIEQLQAHPDTTILAAGTDYGSAEQFPQRVATVLGGQELPGGGMLALDDRILVADYGHPGDQVLGILGEQDLDWAVADVKNRAAEYQALTDHQVIPTFELIATVASASAGDDGDFSAESDPAALRPWIDRAAEEGIYVLLDLQPGHSTFPEQAQQYEELLALPNVGLALDPEWRLGPGEQHMVQIGSVSAAEVNETLAWLDELTAEHALPQKVVVLHQFRGDMLEDRADIDTSYDTLQLVVHVDGHGTPPLKMETWNALTADLPEGMALGWKNFIDEDTPMFTPAETLAIEPQPQLVTYQ